MAESALRGALRRRDGHTERFTVRAEADLRSLRAAVHTLSSALSRALTALVEEEKLRGQEEEEEEESDEEHSAEEEESVRSRPGRPNKRRRH